MTTRGSIAITLQIGLALLVAFSVYEVVQTAKSLVVQCLAIVLALVVALDFSIIRLK